MISEINIWVLLDLLSFYWVARFCGCAEPRYKKMKMAQLDCTKIKGSSRKRPVDASLFHRTKNAQKTNEWSLHDRITITISYVHQRDHDKWWGTTAATTYAKSEDMKASIRKCYCDDLYADFEDTVVVLLVLLDYWLWRFISGVFSFSSNTSLVHCRLAFFWHRIQSAFRFHQFVHRALDSSRDCDKW